jgi:hypothetical protein
VDLDRIDSISIGFAISFCLLYLCSFHSLWLFKWIWLAALAAGLGMLITSLRLRGGGSSARCPRETRMFVIAAALYVGIRAVALSVAEYPLGGDPSYHLVLADKILRSGRIIADWTPFETTELNYPIASHLLLAVIADLGKLPVHQVFTFAMIIFTVLAGAQVYALVSRATRNRELGLYAGVSFLFLAVYGSIDYARWGGLPNLMGVYLVLGLLSLLHRGDLSENKLTVLFAALFVAASFVHHHVMLTAGAILLWQLLYFLWIAPDRVQTRRLTRGLVLSALLGSPYFVQYILKVLKIQESETIVFAEPMMKPHEIMNALGPVFFLSALAGAVIFWRRKTIESFSVNLLQAIASLLLIYVLLQYASPILSRALWGTAITPFIPSRFLTDCVPLLAAFSALFFFHFKEWVGGSKRWMVSLIVAGFILNWSVYRDTFAGMLSQPNLDAYAWIRNHASANAIVIDPVFHTSYLTQRASSSMTIPASEFLQRATIQKIVREIENGRIPPEAQYRQILVIMRPRIGDLPRLPFANSTVIWKHPSGRVNIAEVIADSAAK